MTFVIAEAGVNHNGDIDLAHQLIFAAFESGADAVKFQSFIASEEVSVFAEKAAYQKNTTNAAESQLEMIRKLELSSSQQHALKAYSDQIGIQFLSSPFDLKSVDTLVEIGVSQIKIPSGEITNLPYLEKVGSYSKPVIISSGMSTIGDIESAIEVLVSSGTPRDLITVLHCNTEYPTPMHDVNLRAMVAIGYALGVKVGYSDHTQGIEVPIAAVAMGATIIEKHLTLDRELPGPDHQASLIPTEFAAMVSAIRNIQKAMGDGIKRVSKSEAKNKEIVRKSIVASKYIKAGEEFSISNVTTKRPGSGISPMRWNDVIGRVANRDFQFDELIEL